MASSPAARRLARSLLGILLLLALLAPTPGSSASASQPPPVDAASVGGSGAKGDVAPGVVLVRFRAGVRPERAASPVAGQGAAEAGEMRQIRVRKLRVAPGREREVAARLRADPDVEFAEPSRILHALWIPNDPYYPSQWNLPKINMPQAWGITRGSPSVTVAVVDSGFDVTHPDKPANLRLGTDYVGGGTVSSDPCGHGTHVAGIVGANTNNGIGVAGVAPGVSVRVIRVLYVDSETGGCVGSTADVASGITEAANGGAKVISLSLGAYASPGSYDFNTLQAAVAYAQGKGVLVVAAAGNDGSSGVPVYPAALPGVLAVGATDGGDNLASFSHIGSYVGVVAPGVNVYSTYPCAPSCGSTGTYAPMSGTSMATPHVSALAALIWSSRFFLTADQVVNVIESTAVPLGSPVPNYQFGYGRIDAAAALQKTLTIPIHDVYLPLMRR